jgi:hypothetical protein
MPLLQSKVHNLCGEELAALGVDVPCEVGRIKLLFVKVLKKMLPKWKKSLRNIVKEVTDLKTL